MTIKMRLWIMAVVAVVALAAVFLAGKLGLDSVQSQFNTVVDDRVPKMTQVQQLLTTAFATQRDVRELMGTSNYPLFCVNFPENPFFA